MVTVWPGMLFLIKSSKHSPSIFLMVVHADHVPFLVTRALVLNSRFCFVPK